MRRLALALLCASCASEPTCESGRYTLDIKIYDNPDDITSAWTAIGGEDEVWGFSEWDVYPPIVHVPRVIDEQDDDAIDTWGHELLHVVCGDWHE